MNEVAIARLHELFSLTDDGRLINRVRRNSHARIGDEAGSRHSAGYRKVKVDGQQMFAHRIVFAMAHGKWPSDYIDHINGVRDDNRIENLRDVTFATNAQNIKGPKAHNTTGFLGVSRSGRKWVAQIYIQGRSTGLGTFDSPVAAHSAYLKAKRALHEGCTL